MDAAYSAMTWSRFMVQIIWCGRGTFRSAAVMLLAASGSGKSSLALALLQHGCSLLSDDVVAVHGPNHLVWPGHFPICSGDAAGGIGERKIVAGTCIVAAWMQPTQR